MVPHFLVIFSQFFWLQRLIGKPSQCNQAFFSSTRSLWLTSEKDENHWSSHLKYVSSLAFFERKVSRIFVGASPLTLMVIIYSLLNCLNISVAEIWCLVIAIRLDSISSISSSSTASLRTLWFKNFLSSVRMPFFCLCPPDWKVHALDLYTTVWGPLIPCLMKCDMGRLPFVVWRIRPSF